ncbi:hypothetical protein ACF0H5_001379 [Mactra antiquata]
MNSIPDYEFIVEIAKGGFKIPAGYSSRNLEETTTPDSAELIKSIYGTDWSNLTGTFNPVLTETTTSGSAGLVQPISGVLNPTGILTPFFPGTIPGIFTGTTASASAGLNELEVRNGYLIPKGFSTSAADILIASGKAAGFNWTNNVYFYRNVGDGSKKTEVDIISHERLEWELETIIDTKEVIRNISIYNHKLSCMQPCNLIVLYHNFVFFETDHWYWTIEKNDECILIQRSTHASAVKEFAPGWKRNTPIKLEKKDIARGGIIDLIKWLYRKNELSKTYNLLFSNCQQFAHRVNDYITSWTKQVYLYPDVGSGLTLTRDIRVSNERLLEDFQKLIDVEKPIHEVYIRKQRLPDSQITDIQKYHYFVLFKSEDWYWTIEKNSKYTILQKSQDESGVKAHVQGKDRGPLYRVDGNDDIDAKELRDLLQFLYENNELKNAYDPISDNSKHFAYRVYDCLT